MAALAMAEQNGCLSEMWQLPARISHDVKQLSPAETILFLRRLVLSKREDDSVLSLRLVQVSAHRSAYTHTTQGAEFSFVLSW